MASTEFVNGTIIVPDWLNDVNDSVYGPTAPTTTLRGQLQDSTNVANGDAVVAVKNTATGALATNQHQKNEDSLTVMDFIPDAEKAAIRAFTSVTDLASYIQTYLQYCYNSNKEAIFPAGQYCLTSISLTATGGELSGGMQWKGAGKNATILKQLGSGVTPLVKITGAGNPTTISLMLVGITFEGNGKTCPGLELNTIAGFHIDNCVFRYFTTGLDCKSALIGSLTNTSLSRNNVGMMTRQQGTNAFCNLITIGVGCQIIFNTQFGLDIGVSDTLNVVDGVQIESNGVASSVSTVTVTSATPAVVTWNAHGLVANDPVIFTNSGGALPTGITADYIYYVSATGLTANTFQFSATVGGASVATSSVGTGTHTATSPKTGGIVLRKTMVDELGAVTANIDKARFEGNFGSDFRSEYMATAFGLYVNMRDCLMAGTSDGPMIAIGNARKVMISGCVAPVGTSTWNVATDQLLLENSKVITLKRPLGASTVTTVINSGFNGTDHPFGEKGSFTATLTGVTAVVTTTVTYTIQGHDISITIPPITGTSNTNAATLTGMPAPLWPTIIKSFMTKCTDNGTEKVSELSVQTTGVIVLNNGFTSVFTAAGLKGHSLTNGSYTWYR